MLSASVLGPYDYAFVSFQIKEIMQNIGVYMTGETLDKIYKCTASNHPKGHVSIEGFRNTLDMLEAKDVVTGKHKMAV